MTYNRIPNSVIAGRALSQTPAPSPLTPPGSLQVVLDSNIATTGTLGVVQIGNNINVTAGGVISAALITGPAGPTGPTGPVITAAAAYFYDTTPQLNPVVDTANPVNFNTPVFTNGVTLVGGNQVTVTNAGVYSLVFTVSLTKSSGATTQVSLWLGVNGGIVSNSRQDVTVSNTNDTLFASGNYVIQLSAGDYFQIFWSSASAITSLLASTAAVAPPRPAIPSARITVYQIN